MGFGIIAWAAAASPRVGYGAARLIGVWMAMQAARGLSQRSERNNEAWPCDQNPIPDLPHRIPQGQSPSLHLTILVVERIASVRAVSVFPWDPGPAHEDSPSHRPCNSSLQG